jgi:hypothetical protein
MKPFDFLFYSNEEGKHLFLATDDLVKGRGLIAKTAWNPTALLVAEREFCIVENLRRLNPGGGCTPRPAGRLRIGGRPVFLEEYVGGNTLRDVLIDPKVCHEDERVLEYLERLDRWFACYRGKFEGPMRPLAAFYAPLFIEYRERWPAETTIHVFSLLVEERLNKISAGHEGLIPAVAHNDLWPGNFIVRGDRLVAVDDYLDSDRNPYGSIWIPRLFPRVSGAARIGRSRLPGRAEAA